MACLFPHSLCGCPYNLIRILVIILSDCPRWEAQADVRFTKYRYLILQYFNGRERNEFSVL